MSRQNSRSAAPQARGWMLVRGGKPSSIDGGLVKEGSLDHCFGIADASKMKDGAEMEKTEAQTAQSDGAEPKEGLISQLDKLMVL